eukprot:4845213-Amphidinium_carterae.1
MFGRKLTVLEQSHHELAVRTVVRAPIGLDVQALPAQEWHKCCEDAGQSSLDFKGCVCPVRCSRGFVRLPREELRAFDLVRLLANFTATVCNTPTW